MTDNKKILVGKIVAPQGIRGEVRVQSYTESPTDFQNLTVESSRFATGAFHFVRRLNPTSSMVVARIDGIMDRNAAETLRGTELYITRDALAPLGDGEYYQADLIGFTVMRGGIVLGTLDGFQNFGAGDIMELSNGDMVSFIGANVDLDNKIIRI